MESVLENEDGKRDGDKKGMKRRVYAAQLRHKLVDRDFEWDQLQIRKKRRFGLSKVVYLGWLRYQRFGIKFVIFKVE